VKGCAGRVCAGAVAAMATALLCASAPAGAAEGARAAGEHLLSSPRLLDDPAGVRSRLERLGISLQLFYQEFPAWKTSGGVGGNATFGHSGSYDLLGRVDAEELAGWPGLALLVHVKGQYDRNVNADVGALSAPIDDADFDEPIYVDELWLEQSLLGDRVALRLGFLEQQTLFDRNAYANSEDRQFLSTFLDNDGVVPLPNGLGAALLLRPASWLEVALGVADADNVPQRAGFDSAFDDVGSLSSYLELSFPVRLRGLPGTWRVGAFRDGRDLPVWGRARDERGHWGAWLSADQLVFREDGADGQGLGLFARFGYADPDANAIAWFWSAGLQYAGLLPGRDADVLGAAAYQAIASEDFRDAVAPSFRRETGIEVYYMFLPVPWLAVTPDFQYVVDPGLTGTTRDATMVTLRLRVTF
jgi:porin